MTTVKLKNGLQRALFKLGNVRSQGVSSLLIKSFLAISQTGVSSFALCYNSRRKMLTVCTFTANMVP